MQTFPIIETTFQLPAKAGELEVLVTPKNESSTRNAVAIICHPHPQHGGTMTNKVVTTLAKTFHNLDLSTVRFNFRGVGKSTGSFADGVGEIEDLLTVIEWVKQTCPQDEIWLAGFSFGAYVSVQVASKISVARLISVAIPVSWGGLVNLPPITCPWVVVQGDQDEVVSPEKVYLWIKTLKPKPMLIRFPKAGHFFHGQLLELREQLEKVLR